MFLEDTIAGAFLGEHSIGVGDGYFYWPSDAYSVRGYISFDISSVPLLFEQFILTNVELSLFQYRSIGNDIDDEFPSFYNLPPDSVPCVVDHIDYGDSLDVNDYTAGDLNDPGTLESIVGILSISPEIGWKSLIVTDCVLEDILSGREKSQYRIRFTIDHDDDQTYDQLRFQSVISSNDDPFLALTYTDTTLIANDSTIELPINIILWDNYPNPFNPVTTIQYELPQRSDVQITIYDLLGRQVTTLVSETQDAGYKSIQWNATNVPSGMYFYQIRVGEFVQTRKMVLFK